MELPTPEQVVNIFRKNNWKINCLATGAEPERITEGNVA